MCARCERLERGCYEDDPAIVKRLTAAMREADQTFARVGGSTRHHVQDCLLPILYRHGLVIGLTAALSEPDGLCREMNAEQEPLNCDRCNDKGTLDAYGQIPCPKCTVPSESIACDKQSTSNSASNDTLEVKP